MTPRYEELRSQVQKLSGVIEEKKNRLDKLTAEKASLEEDLPSLREAISLAKKCLEKSLEQKKFIEDIVSTGLTEVFGIPYTFFLEVVTGPDGSIKGLKPQLKEAYGEFDDPINSFGAGAQSIASVCFRIAILLLSSGTAKVIIFDEPLANVSPTLQDRFKAFIETTCKKTGLQLIMVTHMDQPFGKVYEVVKEGKKGKRISKAIDVTNTIGEN